MSLSNVLVPRAGPFRQGDWDGSTLVVVQRRWMTAVICWALAAMLALWVGAGVIWPRSLYVPTSDQFAVFVVVAAGFLVIGTLVVAWKRVWLVSPASNSITSASGFGYWFPTVVEAPNGLWAQVSPIKICAKGGLEWSGYALAIHATDMLGVVVGVFNRLDEATDEAENLADQLSIGLEVNLETPVLAGV